MLISRSGAIEYHGDKPRLAKRMNIRERRYESRVGRDIGPHCELFSREGTASFVSSSFEARPAQNLRAEVRPTAADGDSRRR
jgi:hypothetical protein